MKRWTAILCLLALCLSLCACGQTAQPAQAEPTPEPTPQAPSKGDLMYDKYGSIIDKLEAGDFDGALEEISAMKPEPKITTVTITPENFYDYYELEMYDSSNIQRDAGGRITYFYPSWDYYFVLKDEYRGRLLAEGSGVEVGLTGEASIRRLTIDWEKGSYAFGEEPEDEIREKIIAYYNRSNPYFPVSPDISVTASGTEILYNLGHELLYVWIPNQYPGEWYGTIDPWNTEQVLYGGILTNVQIVRAEGTLLLSD